jgi:hypothetical protein
MPAELSVLITLRENTRKGGKAVASIIPSELGPDQRALKQLETEFSAFLLENLKTVAFGELASFQVTISPTRLSDRA